MTMNMDTLANHILAVTDEKEISINNLQLQKVMYFTFQYACNTPTLFSPVTLKKMYSTPFQVWRYGPVQKAIYEKYSAFNASPIFPLKAEISSFFSKAPFNDFIIKLTKENPFQLIDISRKEPFWKRNANKIRDWRSNVDYSFNDVKDGKSYRKLM